MRRRPRGSKSDRPDSAWVVRWRPRLQTAALVVVLGYGGADAAELERLRREVRDAGGQLVVVRNRDAHQLFAGTPREVLREQVHGPTALVVADGDVTRVLGRLLPLLHRYSGHSSARAVWALGTVMTVEEAKAWLSTPRTPAHFPGDQPEAGAETLSAEILQAMRARLRPLLQGPPLPGDEPTEYAGLTLTGHGPSKIQVIKVIRAATGCSLRDGLRLVDELPARLGEGMSVEQGEALCEELKAAGAEVEVEASGAMVACGWVDWTIDEAAVFAQVPHVELRPGWSLTARVFREYSGGNGVVRARSPQGADGPFVDALEGDGERLGYLYASILIRELYEFGAQWHGVEWGTHEVIDRPSEQAWTFLELAPLDSPPGVGAPVVRERSWMPRVERDDTGHVTVSFFTESSLGSTRLLGHVDRYEVGSLRPRTMQQVCCATAPGGYVF